MCFTDLHTHILANVDDGAENEAEMYDLLDTMYRDGTRCICCTPHYHPGYYGENQKKSLDKFQQLSKYADSRYPDLKLCLGNELHYSQGCLDWIEKGFCRTLNGSRYILVDFVSGERYETIEFAVMLFLRGGYIPVLAHTERYGCFGRKSWLIRQLRDIGAIIQVNASSVIKPYRYPIVKKILRQQCVDVIASDTHNLEDRPPKMAAAYHEIIQNYGKEYADALFILNPNKILDR